MWEPVPGQPGQKGVFWETSTPNLLYHDAAESATSKHDPALDIASGTHTFKFSISVPSTYQKAKSQGIMEWAKGFFGGVKKEVEYEELPMPPTTLESARRDDPQLYLFQYSVWVSVETGPMHDDYKLSDF